MALWGGGNYVAGSARPRCFWRLGATGRWVWGHRISSKTPRSEWHRFWCAGLRMPGRFFARWMTRGSLRMPGRLSARLAAGMAMLAGVGLVICGALLLIGADLVPAVQAIDANDETIFAGRERYISLATADAEMLYTPGVSGATVQTATNLTLTANAGTDVNLTLAMADDTTSLARSGSTDSLYQIAATTKTAALNDFDANTWGYSLDGTTFQAVPTPGEGADLIYTLPGSDTGESTQTLTVHYGMKLDGTLPAGQYTNRVVYAATAAEVIPEASLESVVFAGAPSDTLYTVKDNVLTVRINLAPQPPYGTPRVYFKSNSSAAAQECKPVTASRNGDGYLTITCDITPTTDTTTGEFHIVPRGGNDDVFCQNGTYTPGTSDCEAGEWQWGSFTITGVTVEPDVQTMQNFSCSSLSTGQQIQLQDSRDQKMYWVGKLPDGNCWMTQNLDLDLSTSRTLTPSDTNISSNWTPSTSTTTTISDYNNSDTGKSYDPGGNSNGSDDYYEGTYDPNNPETAHYLVGNYYQWSAATAGHTGNSQSTQSICPKGWTLPSQSQFQALISSGLDGTNFMQSPYYLLRGGYLHNSSLSRAGSDAYYRSSTPYGSGYAVNLFVSSGGVEVVFSSRYSGDSVRCVAAG